MYKFYRFIVLTLLIALPQGLVGIQNAAAQATISSCDAPGNVVVMENCQKGTPDWRIKNYSSSIEGFVSSTSVTAGNELVFYVNTDAPRFSINIYRSGYYAGDGGRLIKTIPDLPGRTQPACHEDRATGLISCSNWLPAYQLEIPEDWVSGIYLAKLIRWDTGGENYIIFVVRDSNRKSEIVFQQTITTYQAYNNYNGKSLYSSGSWNYCPTVSGASRAVQVSFDRPYVTLFESWSNVYLWSDFPLVYWLESQGYDVSYITNIDTHRSGKPGEHNVLLDHRVVLSGTHDEYWTQEMHDAFMNARNAGVHLGFFSSNVSYWRIRLEPDPWTGIPDRVTVSYKTTESGPADPSGHATSTWRDPAGVNNPENSLIGIQYVGDNDTISFPLQVTAEQSKNTLYRHTGLDQMSPGSYAEIGRHLIGWEWDAVVDNGQTPPNLDILAQSPTYGLLLVDAGQKYMVGKAAADTTLYVASSGAMVFASGTNQWSWGLALVEPNLLIQQITYNLLSDMGVQPKTPSLRLVLDGEIEKGDNRALTQFVDTGPDWILVANINRTLESLGLPLSMAIPEDASTKANDVLLVLEDSQKLPVISNITTVTSNSTVTINWDTNRPTYGRIWIQLASGTINYQLTTSRPGQLPVERVATDGSYMENHSIIVDNLLSNTEYFYHVASVDQQGNVSISSEQKFKTERGSIQAEVRNDLRNLYRSGRCWYLRYNNDRMVVYTVLSLGLFLGLIVYVLLRNRRPAK